VDPFALAAHQHGAISITQLRSAGITERKRRTLVERGVLERIYPGVYRARGAPDSWKLRLSAATLWVPGGQASHRSSASLRQLEGFESAPIEVLSDYWTRRTRVRGVRIHHAADLVASDHDEVDGIPCTSLVRTLVDLPAVTHEMKAGIALDDAIRRNPAVLDLVADRHQAIARRGRNGTATMRALLAERRVPDQLVDSGFERRFLRLLAEADIPAPVTQHMVELDGVRCYLDAAWPDVLVAAECDSLRYHLNERAFRWDRRRRRMLELLGWRLLEFTHREVTTEGPLVVRQVLAALELADHPLLRRPATPK
jgi:predicted transcriptional regulator of viral defense system